MQILPQLIPCNTAGTLDRLFRIRCLTSPDRVGFRYFDRETKTWPEVTWKEMADLTSRFQQGLQQENLSKGDRVAIQLKNSIEWVAFEQAALGLGLVIVPLYVDDRPDNVAYILHDAGVKVLLVNDDKQWQDLSVHIDQDSSLKRVVLLNSEAHDNNPILSSAKDWLPEEPTHLQERGGDPHKLATIVYTSGTTGRPKGVMLSHHNILFDTESLLKTIGIDDPHNLEFLSFLPLSHMYERTVGYYVAMMAGAKVSYARSIQQLAEDFQIIKPSIIVTVPRIFERFYDKMQQKLSDQSIVARSLFRLAVHVGWKNFNFKQGTGWLSPVIMLNPLLSKIIGKKIHQLLGGNLRIAASGGAALPETVARTFVGLGVNIFQGYGMTESSPAVTMNSFSLNIPSSVGEVMPGIEVRISDNDELQIKGPVVMLGYWNNHQATSEILTEDGWLRTGDKASIKGRSVYITGRIKDILIMSNGEKIPPVDMEQAITLEPDFEQALIVGEGKSYLTALIVLNGETWPHLAQEHGLDPLNAESLKDKKLHADVQKQIAKALHDFPGYAKVRRVSLSLSPWTIENEMLTPTLKVKRNKVIEAHQKEIDAMYS
ncbi:MAG: long-chain fatty acid--CoA ligase [Gammaproteobacteria bacterium]|nr:long-chain fatty acid--CoA ligase [Gammaproteobacteria bacterium]